MSEDTTNQPVLPASGACGVAENKPTITTSLSRWDCLKSNQSTTGEQCKEAALTSAMKSVAVQSVLEMNVTREKVKVALKKLYKETGTYGHGAEKLLEVVMVIEESEEEKYAAPTE